ncbi:hypothetical protein [Streptomyces canus]|uniref:phosphotriesterase family protein n=1 Tax=Streptomyces canus TaxID=58343 RepID=UPI0036F17EDE
MALVAGEFARRDAQEHLELALDLLGKHGVDPGDVVLAHAGDIADAGYLREVAYSGAYIGCDRFGMVMVPEEQRVMPEAAEKFDIAMAAWQEWQDAPWGRLRHAIAEANLARHLGGDGGPLRILDLAGGDGGDAVRLAARGRHVTIVDYAPAMLAAATESTSARIITPAQPWLCPRKRVLAQLPCGCDRALPWEMADASVPRDGLSPPRAVGCCFPKRGEPACRTDRGWRKPSTSKSPLAGEDHGRGEMSQAQPHDTPGCRPRLSMCLSAPAVPNGCPRYPVTVTVTS